MKKKTWNTSFPELSKAENAVIDKARESGFAQFWPCFPDSKYQATATLAGARKYLQELK